MLRTIILLTGVVQRRLAIANLLREHNPDLSFCSGLRTADLAATEPETLREARLVSFASDDIVPQTLLLQLGYGAYRFYAAPEQYPGLPQAPDEREEDACCFSVIAQSMTIWPDNKKVVGLETFTVPQGTGAAARDRLIFARLAFLFWSMSSTIACAATLESIGRTPARH